MYLSLFFLQSISMCNIKQIIKIQFEIVFTASERNLIFFATLSKPDIYQHVFFTQLGNDLVGILAFSQYMMHP